MTRRRADRIRRITGVQRQMQRAAEWALHDLRRQEDGVRAAQDEVLAALARDDGVFLRLAPALTRRLGNLTAETDALAAEGDRQEAVMREQTGRLKHAERLGHAVGEEIERAGERTGLENLGELIAGGARARLR